MFGFAYFVEPMSKVCNQPKTTSSSLIECSNEELKNQINSFVPSLLMEEGLGKYLDFDSDIQLFQLLLYRKRGER